MYYNPCALHHLTLASNIFTGTVGGITKAMVDLANVDKTTDVLKPLITASMNAFASKTLLAGHIFTSMVGGITKNDGWFS